MPSPELSATHYSQARASLHQALSWYSGFERHGKFTPNTTLQALVKEDLQSLRTALNKLEQKLIRIAAFGLVSKGKSSVINGLVGEPILETGPTHGVTKWPRSLRWPIASKDIKIELIDTPGLDEIAGAERETMANNVAKEADLILFIVSGDISRTEYNALLQLKQSNKPLILVFNKIDLYPDRDQTTIVRQLQTLGQGEAPLIPDRIVLVAAAPPPIPLRVTYPDGKEEQQWEPQLPQLEELHHCLINILQGEGQSLLALNALLQGQQAQRAIARKTRQQCQKQADKLIWQYGQYKALGVGLNPLALLDVIGNVVADLSLIRSLAKLYGLPMTSHQINPLWQKLLISSGGVLGINLALGLMQMVGGWEPSWLGVMLSQGAIAGYGSYTIGQTAMAYLEEGCTWGKLGTDAVIEEIFNSIDEKSILLHLKSNLQSNVDHDPHHLDSPPRRSP